MREIRFRGKQLWEDNGNAHYCAHAKWTSPVVHCVFPGGEVSDGR